MNKILKTVSIITVLLFLRVNFTLAAEQVYFYYTDPAGTPLAMSDSTGNVLWRADYLPFGEETIDLSTVQNNKMFVGKEKDSESGFYYFKARYMDPTAGRFGSPDLVGPVNAGTGKINQKLLANPQQLNRYAYALNNPYSYIDTDGNIVELTSHQVLWPFSPRHTALLLIPDNQTLNWGLLGFQKNQNNQWYATLSAGPGYGSDGGIDLKGELNRSSDAPGGKNRVEAIIGNPQGEGTEADTIFIFQLLSAASNYHNNEGYGLLGNDDKNSNGYAAGLLESVGATMPKPQGNYPGIDNSLPGSAFAPPSLVSSPN